MTDPLIQRPEVLTGSTYKIKWPETDQAYYVTINDINDEETGKPRPFEIFINSKNMEHYAWTVGLTLMVSAIFKRGGDVTFVAEELQSVFDPQGGQWLDGRYIPSVLAAIGGIVERHFVKIGYVETIEPEEVPRGDYEAGVTEAVKAHDKSNASKPLEPEPDKD